MLAFAAALPWALFGFKLNGLLTYPFFFANVLILVAIAAIMGAIIDFSMGKKILPQRPKG